MQLLSISHLCVEYNNNLYLKEICFSIGQGETKIIIGESGGGKSLLAKSIINHLPKDFKIKKGEIVFKGKNIFSMNKEELRKLRGRSIYYITQDPYMAFDPTYKIGKQFKEFLKDKGIEYNKTIVFNTLRDLGFEKPEKIIKQYPFQLSGGMLQRVSIARGVLSGPDLIIADEPTTGLDYELQLEFIGFLKKIIHAKKMSLIFITHNMKIIKEFNEATTLVLFKGEIIEENHNILKTPLHPYTQVLIKSVPSEWKKGDVGDVFVTLNLDNSGNNTIKEGCKFYNRCPYKTEKCKNTPAFIEKGKGIVKCFLYSRD